MEYWSQVREIEASKLIFIDESGVNLALLRLYGRALIGQRARGRKPQKRGRNISIISAISFEGFILKEVLPKIKEGDCLLMDNAKIHLGEMVREIIEQQKARLIYLPPYSPEVSPIENFWSKVKAMLRKLKARTYKDLIEGIESAMLQVTQKDIRNWFTHCCYCTS